MITDEAKRDFLEGKLDLDGTEGTLEFLIVDGRLVVRICKGSMVIMEVSGGLTDQLVMPIKFEVNSIEKNAVGVGAYISVVLVS